MATRPTLQLTQYERQKKIWYKYPTAAPTTTCDYNILITKVLD